MIATTTALALGGLAIGAAGIGMSYYGQKKAAQANAEAIALQRKNEEERRKAMELEASRRRREMVRQQIASRSLSLATATNQGASEGSALPGAYGSAAGRYGVNLLGVLQNTEIGRNIFGNNAGISNAQMSANSWNSFGQMGQGLASLGGGLLRNAETFGRVGTWLGSGVSNYTNFGSWAGSGFNGSGAPLA